MLSVESEAGRGSTFWIELQSAGDITLNDQIKGSSDVTGKPDSSGKTRSSSKKILIVEDNPSNLKLISSQLSALGYKADLASNGKEALKMHNTNEYALVLTDCNMPIMNGYELTAEIRKQNSAIPVIAITADAFPEQEKDCLSAGMNDRIVKPVNLQQLNGMLEKWL